MVLYTWAQESKNVSQDGPTDNDYQVATWRISAFLPQTLSSAGLCVPASRGICFHRWTECIDYTPSKDYHFISPGSSCQETSRKEEVTILTEVTDPDDLRETVLMI